MLPYIGPLNLLMKLSIKCLKHSLCSAYGYTFFTAFSIPLQASGLIAKLDEVPMAFLSCSMNQVQLSVVSMLKKQKATGNIQLWPSKLWLRPDVHSIYH